MSYLSADRDQERLREAARTDDVTTLNKLIAAGCSTNSCDSDGNSALQTAAPNNSCSCATALLEAGAAVDSTNSCGWTALMQAARHGHLQLLRLLLRHGADARGANAMGVTVLGVAAAGGQVAVARVLLDAGASATDGVFSPALLAAHEGHEELLTLLLDRAASAAAAAPHTEVTPLMACTVGDGAPSTASLLLARGGRPNALSAGNLTALQMAHLLHLPALAALLDPLTTVNRGDNGGELTAVTAVCVGDLPALRALLATHPQEARAVGADGVTALMAAAVLGDMEAAQLLLQCGADVNAADDANGWTPLLHALYHRRSAMASLLLRQGGSISVVTPLGHTVYDFACEMQDQYVMRAYVRAHPQSAAASAASSLLPAQQQQSDGLLPPSHKATTATVWNRIASRLRKGKSSEDRWTGSSILEDLLLPPTPPILGHPILPHLPTPLHMSTAAAEGLSEDLISPVLQACAPMQDMTNTDLRWESDNSLLSDGVLILPGDQHYRHRGPALYESCSNESSATENCWSLSASTDTTVRSKRSSTGRQRSPVAEHLTLSLGARELHQVLERLSLTHEAPLFHQQDVDFQAFVELSDDDLQELGVSDTAKRDRILAAIRSLRRKL